jgi:Uma2 family endonuclease
MSLMQTVSVETYHQMGNEGLIGKDTELLYGTIYKKPRKSPMECVLTSVLIRAISPIESDGYFVRSFGPITCADSEPEPNVSVVRGEIDDYLRAHPQTAELVVEVCGDFEEYDRSKLRAYASANLKECWLALGPERRVEVYRRPSGGRFLEKRVFGQSGLLRCHALSQLIIDLDQLFRE